ncbi:MAG: VWA domain-containing protein [Deltaproteobacteria bacterium]|jgi:hypothetical protein|nr:VWA domain-containing protein [Deltaproteobacteria bacterium]
MCGWYNSIRPSALAAAAVLAGLLSFSGSAFAAASGEYDKNQGAGKNSGKRIEVAFVLDTTGSMHGLIDGARKKIWAIANNIVDLNPEAEIYIGLVGYRDLEDDYVTRSFKLTTDIQSIYAELLKFEADGGGDTPESVNEALDVAVSGLGWSDKRELAANRIIFLVGDAPPHMDYKQDRHYPLVIKEAVGKGIILNTVQCGDMRSTTRVWKEMAKLGGGRYMAIPQDGGKVIIIETPYDADILIIQRKMNQTVIPYGSARAQDEVKSKMEMYEKAPAPAAADMSSYVSKASRDRGSAIITGSGDLVSDMKDKNLTVKEEELPAELRQMTAEERDKYIAGKAAEREVLARELAEKVSQRDKFVREREAEEIKKTGADSFDTNVSKTLREQIK